MSLPAIMGIINITPDSFSGDGRIDASSILTHAAELLAQGADILDIGAESTRPGATPLSAEDEWQRLEAVLPTIIAQAHQAGKKVSLDTRHGATAAKAMALGIDIINDVSGCKDKAMVAALAGGTCDIICMHSLTIPADKSITLAADVDVISELKAFAAKQIAALESAGIAKKRFILDPGIGFAKTAAQSLEVLRRIDELQATGCRLLIGHSRKSFLNSVTDAPFADRDALTLAVSSYLLQHRVDILRVHNVTLHRELFELTSRLYA